MHCEKGSPITSFRASHCDKYSLLNRLVAALSSALNYGGQHFNSIVATHFITLNSGKGFTTSFTFILASECSSHYFVDIDINFFNHSKPTID